MLYAYCAICSFLQPHLRSRNESAMVHRTYRPTKSPPVPFPKSGLCLQRGRDQGSNDKCKLSTLPRTNRTKHSDIHNTAVFIFERSVPSISHLLLRVLSSTITFDRFLVQSGPGRGGEGQCPTGHGRLVTTGAFP